jgi:hypothetical protein
VLDTSQHSYYVNLLYREPNGKLAEQIKIRTYSTEEAAMTEATALINSLGGQIYFAKDLESLLKKYA